VDFSVKIFQEVWKLRNAGMMVRFGMVDRHIHDKRKREEYGPPLVAVPGLCCMCVYMYVCMHIHTEKRFMGLGLLKSTSSFREKRKKSREGEVVEGKK
jgi:hypothetical protein